jgi:hypothetical protein
VFRKLSDDEATDLVQQYRNGASTYDLAERFGVHRVTVTGHLRRRGVKLRGQSMTVILGQILLHGVRFTTPLLEVSMATKLGLPVLWPSADSVEWPSGSALTDAAFFRFIDGRDLQVTELGVAISRWIPATDLPRSQVVGSTIQLPLACGKHVTYYPIRLAMAARQGHASAFTASCDCGLAYLIHTEPDGARCKAIGEAEDVQEQFDALPGRESQVQLSDREFSYKMLARST